MSRIFQIGDIVKHFKYDMCSSSEKASMKYIYIILGFGKHSETNEDVVIYRELYPDMYGEYVTYVRPRSMFYSEVDKIKYPDVSQTYRFELLDTQSHEYAFASNHLPNTVRFAQYIGIDENGYSKLICILVDGSQKEINFYSSNPMPKLDDVYGKTWEQLCGMCLGMFYHANCQYIQLREE